MKKLICRIFGHKFVYNFSTMPSKRLCICCKIRQKIDDPFKQNWIELTDDLRTDKELMSKWVINKTY